MNKSRLALGIVLVVAGAGWAAQGLNASFVPQSAMTGEVIWVILGSLGVVVGMAVIWWSRKPNGSEDLPDKEQRQGGAG